MGHAAADRWPGWGPFARTLALARCTSGVLGRLFAEAIETPAGTQLCPARARRGQWPRVLYATLPQVLPQLLSYTLYRWENNIRAAAVLGVVGSRRAGDRCWRSTWGLFQMGETSSVLVAMLALVALVDALSFANAALAGDLTQIAIILIAYCA